MKNLSVIEIPISEFEQIIKNAVIAGITEYEKRKNGNKTMTKADAAKIIGVSHGKVTTLINNDMLQATPDGRITQNSLDDYFTNQKIIG